jgi:hypothetical protein
MENTTNEEIVWKELNHGGRLERLIAHPGLQTFLNGFVLWTLFVFFLALVQFSTPDMPDNDGFYHIKMASLMRSEGLKPAFPYLPLTILNTREFYNHHFLFHVALIPFTFGDLRLGAKWASVLFASLAFLAVWRLLHNQKVPYASLWSLGLMGVSEAFIFRMSITRAQSLSLAVLVIGVNWLLQRKYKRLFFLAFIYVWFYNAFPLLLAVAGVYAASTWLINRRLEVMPLIYTGAGLALGLLINPYFPYNILFAYQHIVPKLVEATAVSVGSEWYPYDTGQLLKNSPVALAAFLSGSLALGLSSRRMDKRTATAFLLASMFGLMLFQSRRFIEYFPAFALIMAAFAWAPVLENWRAGRDLGRPKKSLFLTRLSEAGPALAAVVSLVVVIVWTGAASKASIQSSKPYHLYEGASAWLAGNTRAGERIFQTDWDDFPRLFFYNTHNTYLVGLDPTYMQLYDPDLYALWVEITRGRVENPSQAIQARFGARYILTDLDHGGFISRAAQDPRLVEVYRDDQAVVFAVSEGDQ